VEVPVYVDKAGFHPVHVGALPPECALLTNLSASIEELAIEAAFSGDPVAVYRAICHDPLTASVLSLREIKEMVNDLFARHKNYLPQFEYHKV
jgi:alpha-galactosidase